MKSQVQFFEAVQADFDAGRDPLDQAAIVAWLQEHPEVLEDFSDLRLVSLQLAANHSSAKAPVPATVGATPAQAPLPSRRSWKAIAVTAVAAALLLVILPRWWSDSSHEPQAPSSLVKAQSPPSVTQGQPVAQNKPVAQAQPVAQKKPVAQHAVLLSHKVSSKRSFIARDLAPADPTSGAVVLRMQSSTHHSKP